MAVRATRFLARGHDLVVPDLIVAEVVYVLESVYEAPRANVAATVRSIVGYEYIAVFDPPLLLRAIEVYEVHGLDFAEAYLVACAERFGVGKVASFDRSIDRVATVQRIEP